MGFVKFILTAIGLLLIAIGLVAAAGLSYAQNGLRERIETAGAAIFQAPVKVERVSINPLTRMVTLHKLQVDSPEGFESVPLLTAESLRAEIAPDSLVRPPLQVKDLYMEYAYLQVQHRLGSGVNLVRVIEAAEAAAAKSGLPAGADLEMVIQTFRGDPVEVSLSAGLLADFGLDVEGEPFALNPYQLTPMSAAEAAAEVLRTVAQEANLGTALFEGRASLRMPAPGPEARDGAPVGGGPEEEPVVGVGAPEE